MERGQVGDADHEAPADSEDARALVEDPVDLLDMLEDLVRDDEVDALGVEGERVALDVAGDHLDPRRSQALHVWGMSLEPDHPRTRMSGPNRRDVLPEPRAEVERDPSVDVSDEPGHDVAPVVQRPVDHRPSLLPATAFAGRPSCPAAGRISYGR